ncbi:carboxymuconolactone decarboxylase family protein [soil metagenome]
MSAVLTTLDRLFGERQTTIAKDLKLNYRRMIEESTLSKQESALLSVALAKSVDFTELLNAAKVEAIEAGVSEAGVQEAEESAAIMGMLNIYYRYRHFVEHADPAAKDEYGAAKLRMTSLGNPVLGKEMFETLALAVSAINGCEMCVSSHEKALMHLGVKRDKLHDVARIAAVVKGLSMLQVSRD